MLLSRLATSMNVSLDIAVFVIGTFVAAFVTGLSGFAFGLVAAAIWLQALNPMQTTTLIVAYALIVQGYAVWRLRASIVPARLWPFIGILVVIWSGMRGWSPNEQRAVFQPTGVATFAMCLVTFGSTGAISNNILRLFALGLPALLLGTAAGWALYGRLDEAKFRRVVLSGLGLIVTAR